MALKLVFPTGEYEAEWRAYNEEFALNNEKIIPYGNNFGDGSYESFLNITKAFAKGENLEQDLVPATRYFLVNEIGRIIGVINIRHYLNEDLLRLGGHIGYSTRPSERGHGYAKKALSLALEKCRKMGLEKVLITCDRRNIASAKVIQGNGGTIENEIKEENGNIVQRYWIKL